MTPRFSTISDKVAFLSLYLSKTFFTCHIIRLSAIFQHKNLHKNMEVISPKKSGETLTDRGKDNLIVPDLDSDSFP